MKKIKAWFKGLPSFYLGPTYYIHDKKVKEKDTNNFIFVVSLIFTLILYFTFRGSAGIKSDFSHFFNGVSSGNALLIILLILAGLSLIAGPLMAYFVHKKRYLMVKDTFLYIVTAFSFNFGIKNNTWLIWFVMFVPALFLLYSMGIFGFRLIAKLVKGQLTPEREEDYLFRSRKARKFFNRFLIYLKHNWGQVLIVIALIVLTIGVLYPLYILILRSFKYSIDDLSNPFVVPARFTFDNYHVAWESIKGAFLNSILTSVGVTFGTMILASLLAYSFIRFNFPLKKFLFYAIIALMMIPGILTLISRYRLVLDMGLVGSLWGIVLPGMAGYVPAAFMLLFTFFSGIPHDLFDAADVDGANDLSVYYHIVLPLSKPILSTIAIQTFVGEWNDYLWARLIIGTKEELNTLPVFLTSFSTTYADPNSFLGMGVPFAGYVLSAIPLVLIFIVASKQFIEGLTSGAFKM